MVFCSALGSRRSCHSERSSSLDPSPWAAEPPFPLRLPRPTHTFLHSVPSFSLSTPPHPPLPLPLPHFHLLTSCSSHLLSPPLPSSPFPTFHIHLLHLDALSYKEIYYWNVDFFFSRPFWDGPCWLCRELGRCLFWQPNSPMGSSIGLGWGGVRWSGQHPSRGLRPLLRVGKCLSLIAEQLPSMPDKKNARTGGALGKKEQRERLKPIDTKTRFLRLARSWPTFSRAQECSRRPGMNSDPNFRRENSVRRSC